MTIELTKTPSFRLDGKRALVTGAGRGIGLAAVSALADAGALAREKLRLFPADAAPGAGHQRHLAVEAAHELLLRVDP